jgi:hypothetical protein
MEISKEFIPYEQASALKELGFDKPCFGDYYKFDNNDIHLDTADDRHRIITDNKDEVIIEISAPLYQQAFRWFRENYDLVHTVYSNASGYIWELHYNQERGGTHICDSGESGDCEMSGMFTTYEKAELECLKKLIEIIKEKNQ